MIGFWCRPPPKIQKHKNPTPNPPNPHTHPFHIHTHTTTTTHSVKYDPETGEAMEGSSPYDADSASTIRLSNGMVLYLREVDE